MLYAKEAGRATKPDQPKPRREMSNWQRAQVGKRLSRPHDLWDERIVLAHGPKLACQAMGVGIYDINIDELAD